MTKKLFIEFISKLSNPARLVIIYWNKVDSSGIFEADYSIYNYGENGIATLEIGKIISDEYDIFTINDKNIGIRTVKSYLSVAD